MKIARLCIALALLCLPGIGWAACTGVSIAAGSTADQINTLINANPNNTIFCFASGNYTLNKYVVMKTGTQLICDPRRTCIMTGLDIYKGAFYGGVSSGGFKNQIVRGFIVEHFIADNTFPIAGIQVRQYGLIDDNEIRFCKNGINVSDAQSITNNWIHDNGQYGITGGPGNMILIENNELGPNNNSLHLDPNDDASGSKLVGSSSGNLLFLTWRNNNVHDNYGQGIWSDGNVRYAAYVGNSVNNNRGAGIDHEISWDAIIDQNTFTGNCTSEAGLGKSCLYCAAITVSQSANVSVTRNTAIATNGTNGICLTNSARVLPVIFPQAAYNITVGAAGLGNTVKMHGQGNNGNGTAGNSGAVNIKWIANSYFLDNITTALNFRRYSDMTVNAWKAAGEDVGGTFVTW